MNNDAYEDLAAGYAKSRRADPRIAVKIEAALGSARSVVNIGAGAGSYEPTDREVTAVEPSIEMIAQRPAGSAPVVQACAEELPFEEDSFDAAMAVLTVHHWRNLDRGLAELCRVARNRVVVVTFDYEVLQRLWIIRDYFPGMIAARPDPSSSGSLARRLPSAKSVPLLVPRDCRDLFFAALWARPRLFFDEDVVQPMWGWGQLSPEAKVEGRERLAADLASGAWRRRNDDIRDRAELDVGLRLVIAALD